MIKIEEIIKAPLQKIRPCEVDLCLYVMKNFLLHKAVF